MGKYRVLVELDSYDRMSAKNAVVAALSMGTHGIVPMGIELKKVTKVSVPKHKKGWRASHDARFVKPSSEFGGSCKTTWLANAACKSDSIGPIFKRRKDAQEMIRVHMRLGRMHGWSDRRRDYSITKVK